MAMPAGRTRRYTARQVRRIIAAAPVAAPRYELVDGELLVTPSPGRLHQEAVRLLLIALSAYLERHPVGHPVVSPSDVELEPEDVRQPDLFVVPLAEWQRLVERDWPARELLLAIEVLSTSSTRHDRVLKRPGYQRHVPEYWIVDPESRLVERWRPEDERPEILTEQFEWDPVGAASPMRLDLPAFFARIHAEEMPS